MGFVYSLLSVAGVAVLFLSFGLYALLQLLCGTYFKTQNLKKRYNAQWALVTGASSGDLHRPRSAPAARRRQRQPCHHTRACHGSCPAQLQLQRPPGLAGRRRHAWSRMRPTRRQPATPPPPPPAGIGKEIARKLAAQGLSVVLVALGDPVLDATTVELQAAFPDVQIRKVPRPQLPTNRLPPCVQLRPPPPQALP